MDEFIVIKVMNNANMKLLEKRNEDTSKNIKINKLLEDEGIFFKIPKDIALSILFHVGVNQKMLETTYEKLTSKETFDKLVNNGNININDDKLIVKYE